MAILGKSSSEIWPFSVSHLLGLGLFLNLLSGDCKTPVSHFDCTKFSHKSLKVLSSEMDPAEIRLIRQIFIKGSVAQAFQKNPAGSISLDSTFKPLYMVLCSSHETLSLKFLKNLAEPPLSYAGSDEPSHAPKFEWSDNTFKCSIVAIYCNCIFVFQREQKNNRLEEEVLESRRCKWFHQLQSIHYSELQWQWQLACISLKNSLKRLCHQIELNWKIKNGKYYV